MNIEHQTALNEQLRFVKIAAYKFGRNLPACLEREDLEQVGLYAAQKVLEKFDWTVTPNVKAYLSEAIKGAMVNEIRKAKYGVTTDVPDGEFQTIPFSRLEKEGEESSFLESSGLTNFSFQTVTIEAPYEPEKRLAIYRACASLLATEFSAASAFKKVKGLLKLKDSWGLRFNLMGFSCQLSGYETRKEAAKAKFNLLKHIQEAVTPIDLKEDGKVQSFRPKFKSFILKAEEIPSDGRAFASFMYEDPYTVMCILEKLCAAGSVDWTSLREGS